jgi:hypothetical protein
MVIELPQLLSPVDRARRPSRVLRRQRRGQNDGDALLALPPKEGTVSVCNPDLRRSDACAHTHMAGLRPPMQSAFPGRRHDGRRAGRCAGGIPASVPTKAPDSVLDAEGLDPVHPRSGLGATVATRHQIHRLPRSPAWSSTSPSYPNGRANLRPVPVQDTIFARLLAPKPRARSLISITTFVLSCILLNGDIQTAGDSEPVITLMGLVRFM